MKQPPSFSSGDPSYFVVASTSGSAVPIVLTISNASASFCVRGLPFISVACFADLRAWVTDGQRRIYASVATAGLTARGARAVCRTTSTIAAARRCGTASHSRPV